MCFAASISAIAFSDLPLRYCSAISLTVSASASLMIMLPPLMLTLLAMYAEEESRSASENQKWRIQKMFEQGRPNTGRMLGYCLKDGQLTIIPEEAEIVRMIYEDYLSGMGRLAIANKLNDLHVPTVRGGKEWREGAIYLILRNEKYTGDMILQKTYSEDFRSKKRVINNGERRKYLVEKSHESIISKTVFEQVQEEIARRQSQIKMATHILSRFHKDQCIVCDTRGIDREALLAAKTANRDTVKEALDPKIKELLEEITNLSFGADPFNLRARLLQTIEDGDITIVTDILAEIAIYKHIFASVLQNAIIDAYEQGDITATFREYHELISTTPDISQEDYLYIQEIVSNSMSKRLSVERDENRRLRIRLSNQEFLGLPRDELPLSTGEQNFLSLTFEFLKAKNSASPIVVIDDPVSSFDSIYKNKVVYAIVRILHHKKRIVLTHNTDLIRLLDGQYKHCFKLYLLNNTDGEVNGFIPLRNREQDMLISLEKLLEAFRNDVPRNVQNFELYLISMIPFMRGYANIANKRDIFENLTQVMHGYKTESVDIAQAYIELFGNPDGLIQAPYNVTVSDILLKSVDAVTIVDTNYFPLLNRTLKHSFQYLFLRLAVEKALVDKFNIDTTRYTQLGQIISAAFPDDNDIGQIRDRIRLTSKKTLINEFNHFEGNLSIFQPAIDITDQALSTEKANLMTFIENL